MFRFGWVLVVLWCVYVVLVVLCVCVCGFGGCCFFFNVKHALMVLHWGDSYPASVSTFVNVKMHEVLLKITS